MKKWNLSLKISILSIIVCVVLCGIFNGDDTRAIWEVFRVLLVISVVSAVITTIGCIVKSIKDKEKLPIWIIIFIVIVIVIASIVGIGKIEQNKFENNRSNYHLIPNEIR